MFSIKSPRGGGRVMRLLATTVAALVVAGLVAVVTPTPAAEAATGSRYAGYKIKGGTSAASGWIGSYAIKKKRRGKARQVVYRTQPTKRGVWAGKYKRARAYRNLYRGKRPSARKTHVAAYLLANYGQRKDRIQAAAVDAALYHLLVGKKWRIKKKRGKARIRQAGSSRYIRRYARTMLAASQKYAGPYRFTYSIARGSVGSSVTAKARLVSAAGHGVPNIQVVFRYPGMSNQSAYTGKKGFASVPVTVARAGATRSTATALGVPDHRMWVRNPKRKSRNGKAASPLAVAGVRRNLTATGNGSATSGQSVTIHNSNSTVTAGANIGGKFTVTGGYGARSATIRVHGPFASSVAASCSSSTAKSWSQRIPGAGNYNLPAYRTPRTGYYRYSVVVGGNANTPRASTCGGVVTATGQGQTIAISPFTPMMRGQYLGGRFIVNGGTGARNATLWLHGPFPTTGQSTCNSAARARGTVTVRRSGAYGIPAWSSIKAPSSGYYRWAGQIGGNAMTSPSARTCSGVITVQSQSTLSQWRPAGFGTNVPRGRPFHVDLRIGGFDRHETHTATSALYGPFKSRDRVGCGEQSRTPGKTVRKTVGANGQWRMPNVTVSKPGWYVWKTSINSGALIRGSSSACNVPFNIT